MIYRQAELSDIKQIQVVRHLVQENALSNPDLVPDKDVAHYITEKGRGWVCEIGGKVVGFSIVDLQEKSVWALFMDPDYAEKGIGKKLHGLMIDWYFDQTKETITLGTAPHTRAERFYTMQGWKNLGSYVNGETKFALHFEDWKNSKLDPILHTYFRMKCPIAIRVAG